MPRPRTVTKPLTLARLLKQPRTRIELKATAYAVQLAQREGLITDAGKRGNATLWGLTPKGRRRAKK